MAIVTAASFALVCVAPVPRPAAVEDDFTIAVIPDTQGYPTSASMAVLDAVDRKNKDNFALLTAGGLDFLFLNLEFESPGYSLDWAQKCSTLTRIGVSLSPLTGSSRPEEHDRTPRCAPMSLSRPPTGSGMS